MSPPVTPIVIHLPPLPWPQLGEQVKHQLIDLALRHSGRWQPSQVRLDLPPALSAAHPRDYANLLAWLEQHRLQPLLLASQRSDVRLQVK